MTHSTEFQLELDFDCEVTPSEQVKSMPVFTSAPAQIVCFSSHLRLRHEREAALKDAELLELISSRVRHFK